jgi:hypothetical protein
VLLKHASIVFDKFTLFLYVKILDVCYKYSQKSGMMCGSLMLILEIITVQSKGKQQKV